MAQDDMRSDKHGESGGGTLPDDSTQLKKRARRRLIGAVALALLAAIVLPMVMDHQPAPPLKDIQVRIPSPDEGVTQRVTSKSATVAATAPKEKLAMPPAEPPQTAAAPVKENALLPAAKLVEKPEVKLEAKPEPKPVAKAEPKPEVKPEAKPESKSTAESWEVQLGAYQEPGRVKLLVGKLKEMGIPTYTEKVDTPGGARTRVRAGPFPSQEAAEKARVRVKIVGVDGPVARKQ